MPSKGESQTVKLTVLKIGPRETFGDNGESFSLVVQETDDVYKVFSAEGAEALKSHINETIEITAEYMNEYKGTDQWKIVKVPGWERGAGRGGGGKRAWSPRFDHQQQRAEVIVAAAVQTAGTVYSGGGVTAQEIMDYAGALIEYQITQAKAVAARIPAPQTASQDAAAGSEEAWKGYQESLTAAVEAYQLVESSSDKGSVVREVLVPIAKARQSELPPRKDLGAETLKAYSDALDEATKTVLAGIAGE